MSDCSSTSTISSITDVTTRTITLSRRSDLSLDYHHILERLFQDMYENLKMRLKVGVKKFYEKRREGGRAMKYYIITRSEMELLEKAGLAVVVCPKTKSGYDWSGVESITVEGKTYDSEIHYKRHGNTGEFTSNGVVSYLESEDGDKIKLAPIRYTKKLAIKGYNDVEKIMKNTFHKGE